MHFQEPIAFDTFQTRTQEQAAPIESAKLKTFRAVIPEEVAIAKLEVTADKSISGNVYSITDSLPLQAVTVVEKGTTNGVKTDFVGAFTIDLINTDSILTFRFLGFRETEVDVKSESWTPLYLEPEVSKLDEVVVTAIGITQEKEDLGYVVTEIPTRSSAVPNIDKKGYDQYLKDSLRYPQQALASKIKGRVTLEFTVNEDGSTDNFKIIKGLGYGCDEEAIRLIKEGPVWQPKIENGIAVETVVKLRIRFKPKNSP